MSWQPSSPSNGSGGGVVATISNTNSGQGTYSSNAQNTSGQMVTQGYLATLCAWMLTTP